MPLSPTLSIKPEQLTRVLKRAVGLSWLQPTYFFPTTEDAQHHDKEHIIETGNGYHNGIVINLRIAIAVYFTKV